MELLQEKVGLFAEMTHFQVEEDGSSGRPMPALPRGLFRSESLESPRGERLLQDAIREGEAALGKNARSSTRCHRTWTCGWTWLFSQRGCPPPQSLSSLEYLLCARCWESQGKRCGSYFC